MHPRRDAGFSLSFRLEEALFAVPDSWRLHFLIAAQHDPPYQLGLGAYWPLKPAARGAAARPFGAGFERQVRLSPGPPPRTYSAILGGLAPQWPGPGPPYPEEGLPFL